MIYIIVILVTLWGCLYFDVNHKTAGRKAYYIFECFFLICVAGFRYQVGGDTLNYMLHFEEDDPYFFELFNFDFLGARYNPLWYVFSASCKSIIDQFWFLQIVHALILNITLFWFFKKQTKRYFTAVFFYVLFFYLNYNTEILRGSLAVCAWLYGYESLVNKKWLKYYICCFIAIGFHTEAVLTLIYPICHLLKNIRINLVSLLILSGLTGAFLVFFDISNYLGMFSFMSERDITKLTDYGNLVDSFRLGSFAFIKVLIWIAVLWLLDRFNLLSSSQQIIKGFLIVYIVGLMLAMKYSVMITRPLDTLYPMAILSVAILNEHSREITSITVKKVLYPIVITLFLISGISMQMLSWERYDPYISIFNPHENTKLMRYMDAEKD